MPSLDPLPQADPSAAAAVQNDGDVAVGGVAPTASFPQSVQATPEITTASVAAGGGTPSAAEIAYADATAAGVFRRRKAERATAFLPAGTVEGYGLCLRSPARRGAGYDYVLILMPQRLSGGAISQVDDETLVMRRPADAVPCRTARLTWVTTR
ncbi:hypothetical protein [Jiella pacifica]|uniref:Uncharacterized protein n=1 Tax=Jiella pacifica TaxID=2696469 RepID=A0A6N9T2Q7_9HYPH|nr:hypothetical protein [Jiella pacifica]NDW03288.1 hypothetical protein [Jiella pacifica]